MGAIYPGEWRSLQVYRFVRQAVPTLITLAGTVLLAVFSVIAEEWRLLAIILGILLTVGGAFLTIFARPTRNDLLAAARQAIDHLDAHEGYANERVTVLLHGLMAELGLSNPEHRASLFARLENGDWVLAGRYSGNAFLREAGRSQYEAGQGLVEDTWSRREAFREELPKTRGRWNQYVVREFKMDKAVAEALRMQSRSYGCIRLDRMQSGVPVGVGVLIVESEHPKGVKASMIDDMQNHAGVQLMALECVNRLVVSELRDTAGFRKLKGAAAM